MELAKVMIEGICGVTLFMNALLFISQAIKIFKSKSTQGISLITFLGFLIIQLSVVLHGILHHDPILVVGYLLSMVTCGVVVILFYYYRNNTLLDNENLSEMLESILSIMPGHLYWVGKDGTYLGCNENQAKSAGLNTRQDIKGKRNQDLPWNFNSQTLPEVLDQINQEVMETGKTLIVEEPAVLKDGTQRVFLSNKVPLRNKEGSIIGMVGISIDITDKKQMEAELILAKNKAKAVNIKNMCQDVQPPLSDTVNFSELLEKEMIYHSQAEALLEALSNSNLTEHPEGTIYHCLGAISDIITQAKKLNENLLLNLALNTGRLSREMFSN